jgi:exonuclease VII small subunit
LKSFKKNWGAAQKAVEELTSNGLLNKNGIPTQADKHQSKLEQIVDSLPQSQAEIDSTKVYQIAEQTAEKCSKIMQTYWEIIQIHLKQ